MKESFILESLCPLRLCGSIVLSVFHQEGIAA